MRKFIGLFAAAVIAGGGLAACGNGSSVEYEDDYDGLCRDSRYVRVDDDKCEDRLSGFYRVKMKTGKTAPKMGQTFKASDIAGDDADKKKKKTKKKTKKKLSFGNGKPAKVSRKR